MFAAPFSYTLRGMTKLMEWRAPAEPDSAAASHRSTPLQEFRNRKYRIRKRSSKYANHREV